MMSPESSGNFDTSFNSTLIETILDMNDSIKVLNLGMKWRHTMIKLYSKLWQILDTHLAEFFYASEIS